MLSRGRDYIDFLILGYIIHNPVFLFKERGGRGEFIYKTLYKYNSRNHTRVIFQQFSSTYHAYITSISKAKYRGSDTITADNIDSKRLFSSKGEHFDRVRDRWLCITYRNDLSRGYRRLLAPTSSPSLQYFEHEFLPLSIPSFLCQVLHVHSFTHDECICQQIN